MKNWLNKFSVFLMLYVCQVAWALQPVPSLEKPVKDTAFMFSPSDEKALTEALDQFNTTTGLKAAVVTVDSVQDESIEAYSRRLFRVSRGTSDYQAPEVIFVLAKKERKVRLEVDTRLLPNLPQSFTDEVVRNNLVPAFKERQFAAGFTEAVAQVQQKLAPRATPAAVAATATVAAAQPAVAQQISNPTEVVMHQRDIAMSGEVIFLAMLVFAIICGLLYYFLVIRSRHDKEEREAERKRIAERYQSTASQRVNRESTKTFDQEIDEHMAAPAAPRYSATSEVDALVQQTIRARSAPAPRPTPRDTVQVAKSSFGGGSSSRRASAPAPSDNTMGIVTGVMVGTMVGSAMSSPRREEEYSPPPPPAYSPPPPPPSYSRSDSDSYGSSGGYSSSSSDSSSSSSGSSGDW